jgi:hypothetical protein
MGFKGVVCGGGEIDSFPHILNFIKVINLAKLISEETSLHLKSIL